MVRKTHQGRPGTRAIQDDYGERHAPAANQTQTSVCEIRGPDVLGTFDPNTGAYNVVPGPLRYRGSCRVVPVPPSKMAGLVTEQMLPAQGYQVSIDHAASNVLIHDRVTITESEDAQLIGQVLPVVVVLKGSMRLTRDLICIDDLST
jgi:hypothetical protein